MGSQIPEERAPGSPAKLLTPPQRPQSPAAVISETHMCINQVIAHLTPPEPVCLGFLQVPGALVIFGFENKVQFN